MRPFSAAASTVTRQFELTAEQIQRATDHFIQRLECDLQDATAINTQIPSFISHVPDGTETGTYLAADLGGTNLRVCIVSLHGQSTYTTKQTRAAIPPDLMSCNSWHPLFTFVAKNIKDFLAVHQTTLLNDEIHRQRLAFSFSFTVEQTSVVQGTLVRWDKGFDIPSAIGLDPCVMLQHELDFLDVPVQVVALANDTVGTLMAQQYLSGGKAILGAVFGTGTNGAYYEELANIGKLSTSKGIQASGCSGRMVINTEWGGLDDKCRQLPLTEFDLELDRRSLHPGEQRYEKLVSGMYLGEIFRLALLEAVRQSQGHAFSDLLDTSPICREWSIPSSILSILAEDTAESEDKLVEILQQALETPSLTTYEVVGLKTIAKAIGRRAGRLAGVAVGAVIVRTLDHCPEKAGDPSRASGRSNSLMYSLLSSIRTLIRYTSDFIRQLVPKSVCQYISASLRRYATDPLQQLHPFLPSHPRVMPNQNTVYIGLDGSVAALYPKFLDGIRQSLREIQQIGPLKSDSIRINIVRDGSSMGSALIAQAAIRQVDNRA